MKTITCKLVFVLGIFIGTVGTKIIADPEKCFQELFPKITDFIAGWAWPRINYRFQ